MGAILFAMQNLDGTRLLTRRVELLLFVECTCDSGVFSSKPMLAIGKKNCKLWCSVSHSLTTDSSILQTTLVSISMFISMEWGQNHLSSK